LTGASSSERRSSEAAYWLMVAGAAFSLVVPDRFGVPAER